MPFADSLAFSSNVVVMIIVYFLIGTVVLYFTRVPAHRAILSLTRVLHGAMRMAAGSVMRAERKLEVRNREVLMAQGREASERIIEREFERIEANVRRDIAQCTALDRMMNEELTKIEEDYKQSKEVPPAPPGWAGVVQAIAEVPAKGDPMVVNILEQIHESLVKSQDQAITAYRAAIQSRHNHLKNMMPHWRQVLQLVSQVKKNIETVIDRSRTIDRHMEEYENVVRQTDRAERMLSSSSLNQFMIAGLVMIIAVGGAFINFHLIARPMAEMVGGTSSIGSFKIAEIAALVIILVELAMGVFLMESFRITRLFPIIGALPDKTRFRLIWVFFGILFILACVEAGLAYMREILLEDELATSAALRGEAAGASPYLWITTMAQMLMGFILPFALSFVAIPLESFIQSLRTVSGIAAAAFLQGLAVFLRVLGNAFKYTGELLVDIYDILICVPLWCENMIRNRNAEKSPKLAMGSQRKVVTPPPPPSTSPSPATPSPSPMKEAL